MISTWPLYGNCEQFDMMVYAKARHGITERPQIKHYQTMMLDFVMKNLHPGQ